MTTTERAKVFDFILDGDDGDAILRRSKPIEEFLSLRIQGEDVSGTLSPEERAANLPQFGTGMTLKGCHNITLARVLLKFLADTAKLKYKGSKNTTGVCIFSLSLSLSLSFSLFFSFFFHGASILIQCRKEENIDLYWMHRNMQTTILYGLPFWNGEKSSEKPKDTVKLLADNEES
jgi:hypothetical protein